MEEESDLRKHKISHYTSTFYILLDMVMLIELNFIKLWMKNDRHDKIIEIG
jgi:hypothetical protein